MVPSVLEEAAKPEGNKLENRFQDKDNSEDVIANLQGFVKNLWLLVVLHGHGDDVEADDAGDEQIQVVAGAHLVNQEAETGVIRVVGLTLSFCSGEEESERQIKGFLCVFLKSMHPHSPTPGMINSRPITATCCLFYFLFSLLACYRF